MYESPLHPPSFLGGNSKDITLAQVVKMILKIDDVITSGDVIDD